MFLILRKSNVIIDNIKIQNYNEDVWFQAKWIYINNNSKNNTINNVEVSSVKFWILLESDNNMIIIVEYMICEFWDTITLI